MEEKALFEIDVEARGCDCKLLVYENRYDIIPTLKNLGFALSLMKLGNKIFGSRDPKVPIPVYYDNMVSAELYKHDSSSGYFVVSGKHKAVRYAFDETQADIADKVFNIWDKAINKSGTSQQNNTRTNDTGNNFCPYCGSKTNVEYSFCKNCGKEL